MGTEETSTTSTTAAEEPSTKCHICTKQRVSPTCYNHRIPLAEFPGLPTPFDKFPGRHLRGCSRVLFLVEGPPFRAAAAALMGMVSFPVTSTPASHQNSIKLGDTIAKCEWLLLSVLYFDRYEHWMKYILRKQNG